jgi:hypothetical protein
MRKRKQHSMKLQKSSTPQQQLHPKRRCRFEACRHIHLAQRAQTRQRDAASKAKRGQNLALPVMKTNYSCLKTSPPAGRAGGNST